jgi:hypothetical protein
MMAMATNTKAMMTMTMMTTTTIASYDYKHRSNDWFKAPVREEEVDSWSGKYKQACMQMGMNGAR